MWKTLKTELNQISAEIKKLDQKVVYIFLSVAILQTISFYFTSPKFFRINFYYQYFDENIFVDFIEYGYWLIADFIVLFIFPFLIVKFLFREKIINYGLRIGDRRFGIISAILSIIFFIPIILLISNSVNFTEYFPLYQGATEDISIFLFYEILLLLFLFGWEFFFRGFMLFGLEEKFGMYSIFIQMIPFVILHNGKPFVETFASIFGAIFLGYLALRTRSILYGFFIHAIILVTLDVLSFFRG